jgi:hypothetical protein
MTVRSTNERLPKYTEDGTMARTMRRLVAVALVCVSAVVATQPLSAHAGLGDCGHLTHTHIIANGYGTGSGCS